MDAALITLIQVVYVIASLALFSVGLAVIFGMMRVMNLAHGEFLMLGAYAVLVPASWSAASVRTLFEQPVLTQPGRKRVVFAVPVARLAAELRRAQASAGQVVVEHVYDF